MGVPRSVDEAALETVEESIEPVSELLVGHELSRSGPDADRVGELGGVEEVVGGVELVEIGGRGVVGGGDRDPCGRGVTGVVVQLVGLLRWVFVVPGLATAHTATGADESTRSSAEVTFDAVHQYGGVVLGEHLGQLFTITWIVMIATMMFDSSTFPRWLGWSGLVAAAVYAVAQLELMSTVIDDFPHWDRAGLIGSLLWLVWMLAIGIRLVTIRANPIEDEPPRLTVAGVGETSNDRRSPRPDDETSPTDARRAAAHRHHPAA